MAFVKHTSYHYEVLVSESFRIKVYGPVAVVAETYPKKGSSKGIRFGRRGRPTDTWIRTSGTWRRVASHDSLPVKE
jgi:hypothetical protein